MFIFQDPLQKKEFLFFFNVIRQNFQIINSKINYFHPKKLLTLKIIITFYSKLNYYIKDSLKYSS